MSVQIASPVSPQGRGSALCLRAGMARGAYFGRSKQSSIVPTGISVDLRLRFYGRLREGSRCTAECCITNIVLGVACGLRDLGGIAAGSGVHRVPIGLG